MAVREKVPTSFAPYWFAKEHERLEADKRNTTLNKLIKQLERKNYTEKNLHKLKRILETRNPVLKLARSTHAVSTYVTFSELYIIYCKAKYVSHNELQFLILSMKGCSLQKICRS